MKSAELERRTLAFEAQADGGTLAGLAIVTNQRTTIGSGYGAFDEVILPVAIERALTRPHDVRAFWNHDSNLILGRTKSGTLALRHTSRGLEVTIRPPDSDLGRHFHEVVKRGDVDGMSFGFIVLEERRTEGAGGEGRTLREVLDLELVEVSPVVFPAYKQTELSARQMVPGLRKPNELAARKRLLAALEEDA